MIKRLGWFVGGVAAGAVGAQAARRKAAAVAHELAPVQVAKRAGGQVRKQTSRVADAVREGRHAARSKESELRARMDGRMTSLADELDDIDQVDKVFVDGRPVEPGQVIVLRQVRDERARSRKRA
jgi:molybdopterin-guanine dinucleotide biosynthesis protein